MATLEKIRNRAGVLVAVVIGFALLAFILGDFLNSGRTLFSNSQFEIAEIAGKSVSYQKYQKELNDLTEINKFSSGKSALDEKTTQKIKEQTWNQMLRDYVLEDEYSELGIDVSSQELWDMVQGENIHPIIRNLFTNPETGELNTVAVIRFLKSYDQDPTGQQKAYWLFIENQMIKERMLSKYISLIGKGLYATKNDAQFELNLTNKKVDFDFVSQNINTIADSLINVTSSEIKDYYTNHQNDYKQTASRSIEYITFDVVPSEADKKATEEWINETKDDFAKTESDNDFLSLNSDVAPDNLYYTKDELPDELKGLFDAEVGTMYGPYLKDDIYQVVKLSDIAYLPDSVKARHILIQPSRNQTSEQVFTLADSIVNLLKKGANFASLSNQFSADKAANEKGGELGWFRENQMVSPFSDTCFKAKIGEYKLVATQYGLHIVQVTNKSKNEKKVKIAILGRKFEASSVTYQQVYAEASKFAGNNTTFEDFNKTIQKEGYTKKVAPNVKEEDQELAGFDHPRELVRAIFTTDLHQMVTSQNNAIFELGDRFVIAFVTDIKEKGIAPLEQVQAQVTVQVKKEKKEQLIADKFNEALKENSDLNSLAEKFNTKVYEATDVNFRSFNIPYAGIEPNVVAVATTLNVDQISKPIKGNNGVFVIKVTSSIVEENTNADQKQKQIIMQYQNRANYDAYEALKDAANIVDRRSKFY